MKKFFAILLAMLMVFSMVACSNNNTEPTDSVPELPNENYTPEDVVTEYDAALKLVFTNESVSFTLDKFLLDNATESKYKHKVDGPEADESVELKSVALTVFDKNDAEKTEKYYVKFDATADLLASDNITVSKEFAGETLAEAFAFVMMNDIEKLGLKDMGVIITGNFLRQNGDQNIGDMFSVETTLVIENKIDMTKYPTASVVLTETGAKVTLTDEVLKNAFNPTKDALKVLELVLYVDDESRCNYEEKQVDVNISDATDNVIEFIYNEPVESNKELKYGFQDNGRVYLMLTVREGDNVAQTVILMVTELTADYEIPDRDWIYDEANPDAQNPNKPNDTETPDVSGDATEDTESEDTTEAPENETTGGNE